MEHIRQAEGKDASRIAEILVFTKRVNYRRIFNEDLYSFGVMQVLPLAMEYLENPAILENIYVYDDAFVKGMVHMDGQEIKELYVDTFFQQQGIGGKLIEFAVREKNGNFLWVLEKNYRALGFYQRNGFALTGEWMLEEGTPEYLVKMALQ